MAVLPFWASLSPRLLAPTRRRIQLQPPFNSAFLSLKSGRHGPIRVGTIYGSLGFRGRSLVKAGDRGERTEKNHAVNGDDNDYSEIVQGIPKLQEREHAGTPCVPAYVMMPLGSVYMNSELVDPDGLVQQLNLLKSTDVDGVMVDCWWGLVEAHTPQH